MLIWFKLREAKKEAGTTGTTTTTTTPAHTIQDPRKPQNCLGEGGGGDPYVLNRVQH